MNKQLALNEGLTLNLTVTSEATESSTIIQQWLYQFTYDNNGTLHHDTYRDMIISAKTYEEAEVIFTDLLVGDSYEYDQSTWTADVIGIDLKLNRTSPLVCTDFLYA